MRKLVRNLGGRSLPFCCLTVASIPLMIHQFHDRCAKDSIPFPSHTAAQIQLSQSCERNSINAHWHSAWIRLRSLPTSSAPVPLLGWHGNGSWKGCLEWGYQSPFHTSALTPVLYRPRHGMGIVEVGSLNGMPLDINGTPSKNRNSWNGRGRAACSKFSPFSSF